MPVQAFTRSGWLQWPCWHGLVNFLYFAEVSTLTSLKSFGYACWYVIDNNWAWSDKCYCQPLSILRSRKFSYRDLEKNARIEIPVDIPTSDMLILHLSSHIQTTGITLILTKPCCREIIKTDINIIKSSYIFCDGLIKCAYIVHVFTKHVFAIH